MRKKRSHKLRNGALGLGGLAGVGYLLLTQCDGGLGLIGQGADWAREKAGLRDPEPIALPSDLIDAAPPPPPDAGAATRCELRLDSGGLSLDGEPAELEEAVAACERAGVADLVVTGDARYGAFEELEAALEAAGVEVYTR